MHRYSFLVVLVVVVVVALYSPNPICSAPIDDMNSKCNITNLSTTYSNLLANFSCACFYANLTQLLKLNYDMDQNYDLNSEFYSSMKFITLDCNYSNTINNDNLTYQISGLLYETLLNQTTFRRDDLELDGTRVRILKIKNALNKWPRLPDAYQSLFTLDLSFNSLSGKMGDLSLFIGRQTLKRLILNNNQLDRLNERVCELSSLQFLDLSRNMFESIDINDLACASSNPFGSLVLLDLSYNRIRQIDSIDQLIVLMPRLKLANFVWNNLTALDYSNMSSLSPRVVQYAAAMLAANSSMTMMMMPYNSREYRLMFGFNKMTKFNFNFKNYFQTSNNLTSLVSKKDLMNRLLRIDLGVNHLVCDEYLQNDLIDLVNVQMGTSLVSSLRAKQLGLNVSTSFRNYTNQKINVTLDSLSTEFMDLYLSILRNSLICRKVDILFISSYLLEIINDSFSYDLSVLFRTTVVAISYIFDSVYNTTPSSSTFTTTTNIWSTILPVTNQTISTWTSMNMTSPLTTRNTTTRSPATTTTIRQQSTTKATTQVTTTTSSMAVINRSSAFIYFTFIFFLYSKVQYLFY